MLAAFYTYLWQMRYLLLFFLLAPLCLWGQEGEGLLMGTVLDGKGTALQGATVQLTQTGDSTRRHITATDAGGAFHFSKIPFGYFSLKISYTGYKTLLLDSLHFRKERFDFNLNDLVLGDSSGAAMEEVIVYAEKPLVQVKEGNITFNVGETALGAGSNASDLLTHVPLVTKDPAGKILVRGKEPRILIDDKPVELNLQQLQDLLEAMPGSSIEKVEVLTNPPPQYAAEQGGVINIVTKKGTIGLNGRLTVFAGSRGEAGTHLSFNYRKQGLTLHINGGLVRNIFEGEGWTHRQNIFNDSVNFFNTENRFRNGNWRPSLRAAINYDLDKRHGLNLVLQWNGNRYDNNNITEYANLNRFEELYRLRERSIRSRGNNVNPNLSFTYTFKTGRAGETLRLFTQLNQSGSRSTRDFEEAFYYPNGEPTGRDSAQQQVNDHAGRGANIRIQYDVPFVAGKTFFSTGAYYNQSRSDVRADAYYRKMPEKTWAPLDVLTNHFLFRQKIANMRASLKQVFGERFSVTAGLAAERTQIHFDLYKTGTDSGNAYWSWLPFASLNQNWKEVLNLTFSYRKTIRRPGINELNPTVDFSDPFNIRFGNIGLRPSLAHQFDLVVGRTKPGFYLNLGLGFNKVEDIYQSIRTRIAADTTQTTWQNISGRREYEVSTWSGYTLTKRLKLSLSASYTYNQYSDYDKTVRKFMDGGSLTSNLNTNFTWKDLYTATGSFTFNRFANPQGTVRSTLGMNLGLQARLLQKKLLMTLNVIDPFVEQASRSVTYASNFTSEQYSTTQTRNFRLSVGYVFQKSIRKKPDVQKVIRSLPEKKG